MTNAHDTKNVNATVQIKKGPARLIGAHVSKVGAASAKCELRNGEADGDELVLTVYGEGIQNIQDIYRTFGKGLRAVVTGTAEYIIIFE